ncbi:hypothetical protein Afil01_25280 [Actinorhabdospora filicis]|uniref:NB-ARC domain-containing protein n=1 Tax=Actinorhabdospora filicis TaxID=1785913 RepID=A0A9W6W9N2_9ACTN|nr:XRE family transcriptional regulator [Actinorhabdospora filicis]GLZ77721.1 hypothetical protein Afil01_25280 [Actinorhabdospora filicis]
MSGGDELDPRRARTSADLVAMLRALKNRSGLSYREIEQRARDAGDWLPASTLATVLGRTTVPRVEVVAALVQACGGDPDTVSRWVDAARALPAEGSAHVEDASAAPVRVVPRQLPGDLGTFVGRAKTLDALDGVIDRASEAPFKDRVPAPIVALVGPGGIGKTALAVRWAHSVAARFPDGQLFADLKGFSDTAPVAPSLVLHRFLRALGVSGDDIPSDVEERTALYRSMLAGRKIAIVLDNARDAAQVRPLLPGVSGCLVVVTSRVELRGLGVSHDLHAVSLDGLTLDEGVQLLVRLLGAQRVRSEAGAAVDLVELCRPLPLALRLAAAQLAVDERQSLARFARRVREAGRLSTLAVPDDPDTALRTTFDLSLAALSPEAQRMLRLTGGHPGPDMGLESLATLAERNRETTRRLMDELATLHLVRRVGPDRWEFHDLVREYVAAHLVPAETGEQRRILGRLFDWYEERVTAVLRHIAPGALRPDQFGFGEDFESYEDALLWMDEEAAGVVAAIVSAERAAMPSHVFAMAGLAWRYFLLRGQYEQWIATGDLALDMAHRFNDVQAQMKLSLNLGNAWSCMADPGRALEHWERCLSLARHAGDREYESYAVASVGVGCIDAGRYGEAREHLTAARAIFEEAADPESVAGTCLDIGRIDLIEGDFDHATREFERGLEIFTRTNERRGAGTALFQLGTVLVERGEWVAAGLRLKLALETCEEAGFVLGQAMAHSKLSLTATVTGTPEAAAEHHSKAVELARQVHEPSLQAEILINAGRAALLVDEPQKAVTYYRGALQHAERAADHSLVTYSRDGIRAAERALGR